MPYRCKGGCDAWPAERAYNGIYGRGFKWCAVCCAFVLEPGRRCPCCGVILRTRPRKAYGILTGPAP